MSANNEAAPFQFEDAMAMLLAVVLVLVFLGAISLPSRGEAQAPRNPCTAIVFKRSADSLYAELQAPRGTKVCRRVELEP